MKLPFTVEQFFDVFKQYNIVVWPFQFGFVLLAILAVFLANKKTPWSKSVVVILIFYWLWMGIVYHWIYFTAINKAAFIFGALFIIQAIIFFVQGFWKKRLLFRFHKDLYGITGAIIMVFALIIYPILNYSQGHVFPRSPTFGLPCPTTIFTLGLLLWVQNRVSIWVLIIPFIWSIIGLSAVFVLGIYEDVSLLAAVIISLIMTFVKNSRLRRERNSMAITS